MLFFFYLQASVAFFTLIALEYIIAIIKGRRVARANDAMTSLGAGVNSRLIRLSHVSFGFSL